MLHGLFLMGSVIMADMGPRNQHTGLLSVQGMPLTLFLEHLLDLVCVSYNSSKSPECITNVPISMKSLVNE